MPRITWFEYFTEDAEKDLAFYKAAFGWEFTKWESPMMQYWLVMTAPKDSTEPGINGGLLPRKSVTPVNGAAVNAFVCTIQVENYADIEGKILAGGGTVAVPKFAFPGMAWQGYYKDTEGNIFGLHQTDKEAK